MISRRSRESMTRLALPCSVLIAVTGICGVSTLGQTRPATDVQKLDLWCVVIRLHEVEAGKAKEIIHGTILELRYTDGYKAKNDATIVESKALTSTVSAEATVHREKGKDERIEMRAEFIQNGQSLATFHSTMWVNSPQNGTWALRSKGGDYLMIVRWKAQGPRTAK